MKHLYLLLALYAASAYAVSPFIQPRSQSEDSARDLIGLTPYINLYDNPNCLYGCWAFTFEYTRTNNPDAIRKDLFGQDLVNDKEPFIVVSGSQVGDRNTTDWLADYFGLPTDFESKLFFKPQVTNFIGDISFYLGLDEWQEGLYFRFHAPIVHTSWNLNFTEEVINAGVNGYSAGYFAPSAIPRSQLLASFTDYASNGSAPQLGGALIFNPLSKAKISTKAKSKTRLSDIQAAFGWNFLQGCDHHFGLNIRMAAPTGNRPKGDYLFEPLVGNGHHWELGLGVTGHVLLFDDQCRPRTVGLYFDANITHLFSSRQTRTFDLLEKPLSRYMLAQRLGTPVTNLLINTMPGTAAGSVAPTAQFQNLYLPVANLTTIDVNVSIAAQVDATAMIDIDWGHWNFDFGYNFWARTCEAIKPTCQCSIPFNQNLMFALKGDANTYGFVAQDAATSPVPVGTPIPLSATQSHATIHAGRNTPIGTAFDPSQNQNPGIDGGPAQWAMVSTTTDNDQIVILPGQSSGAATQQRSSLAPVFIKSETIDFDNAQTKGLSNKLFAHITYNWDSNCYGWIPFAGVGGFIEFAHEGDSKCSFPDFDNSCQTVAFSQWGIWAKAGVAF